jgi:hypothetical protein
MGKKFTTSAQKTLSLTKVVIIKKLEDEMSKDTGLVFQATKRENIKQAKLKDGSKIIIAAFDKADGKTLAMIDHKDLPIYKVRAEIQNSIRQKLDKIFT